MRTRLLVLAALAVLPLACKDGGCGNGSSGSSGGATSATAALSASAQPGPSSSTGSRGNRNMMVRAGGAVGALFRAASQLDLKDEQKTKIEKIATDMRDADKTQESDGGTARKSMRGVHEEMIAGVKAGKIDASKLDPHLASLEKDAKERNTRDLEGLAKLHAVLEPAQRTTIASSVKKNDDERATRAKAMEAQREAHAPDGGRPSTTHRRYERYGRELDLDAEQKKKLDGIIPKEDPKAQSNMREDNKKRSDTVLVAFEKDAFDVPTLPGPDTKRIRQPLEEQVKFLNQLIPLLKPEQKDKLVARLEKQAPPMEHGRRHGAGAGEGEHENENEEREDREPR